MRWIFSLIVVFSLLPISGQASSGHCLSPQEVYQEGLQLKDELLSPDEVYRVLRSLKPEELGDYLGDSYSKALKNIHSRSQTIQRIKELIAKPGVSVDDSKDLDWLKSLDEFIDQVIQESEDDQSFGADLYRMDLREIKAMLKRRLENEPHPYRSNQAFKYFFEAGTLARSLNEIKGLSKFGKPVVVSEIDQVFNPDHRILETIEAAYSRATPLVIELRSGQEVRRFAIASYSTSLVSNVIEQLYLVNLDGPSELLPVPSGDFSTNILATKKEGFPVWSGVLGSRPQEIRLYVLDQLKNNPHAPAQIIVHPDFSKEHLEDQRIEIREDI